MIVLVAASAAGTALADDETFALVIQDHRFEPAELTVPAGKKVKLVVENRDATPEEFESFELNREKVIAGKSSATLLIGPLKPGQLSLRRRIQRQDRAGRHRRQVTNAESLHVRHRRHRLS